jgi:hypothetical protein
MKNRAVIMDLKTRPMPCPDEKHGPAEFATGHSSGTWTGIFWNGIQQVSLGFAGIAG